MFAWFRELDGVLRGEGTRVDQLADGKLSVSCRRLAAVSILLAVSYGLCMGFFAVFNRDVPEWRQPVASMIKVPALFVLTLIVTFPSLYVFNALIGSRLSPITLARLMAATLGVITAVLASFGPIIAFFSVTSKSYSFILLLNVVMFAISGLLGLNFLFRTLSRLIKALRIRDIADLPAEEAGLHLRTIPSDQSTVRSVFSVWVVVFSLVGMQMSWVLRPFLGNPDGPFAWFRPRSSSFFEAILAHLHNLFGG